MFIPNHTWYFSILKVASLYLRFNHCKRRSGVINKISACEDINEEDRKKGMGYVWEKKSLFYKDCLALGPKYKVDRELATRMLEALKKKANELYEEHLQLGPEYKTGLEDDLESGTNDEVT